MGEKKMAVAYARYMLCYIFYLVAIVLATIFGLTEYGFAYKIVYFFKIAIIVFVTGSVIWDFKIKRLLRHLPRSVS
ncbi:MAG: hypothetical protein WA667_01855 [Candidatus Nitrosopolaris sp.]